MEALDMQPTSVLVPDGRDPAIDYASGPGSPASDTHPPVNYHAYAACTRGGFFDSTEKAITAGRPILLVLRKRLKEGLAALRQIRKSGLPVAITLKESGRHQVAGLLASPRNVEVLRTICQEAQSAIASTPWLVPLYNALGCQAGRTVFLPTPYPVDIPEWDFSRPFAERSGVFIGTREFLIPSRNHLLALSIAKELECAVTVINVDGKKGRELLEALEFPAGRLTILEKRLSYPAYIDLMSQHRFVLQCDRSGVPGQVAGDALLCGTPCLGGDGAVDQLAGPELTGSLENMARQMLSDETSWQEMVGTARERATAQLSFHVVARQLSRYWAFSAS